MPGVVTKLICEGVAAMPPITPGPGTIPNPDAIAAPGPVPVPYIWLNPVGIAFLP